MTQRLLDPAIFSLHLTASGYVVIDSGQLSAADEVSVFGPSGQAPPRALAGLVGAMLNNITAAPNSGETDAADLRVLAHTLKTSLVQVETTLAGLENKTG